jgi:RND family efflux transporter MFP subunit
MRHRFPDAQRRTLVYRSTRYLLAGALAALLSGGCREAAEQPAAHKAGATTASATRTAGPAAQEAKGHTHDAATAPHAHEPADQEGIRLSAAARANLNLDVAEVATQTIEQVLNIPGVVKVPSDRMALVTSRLPARIEKVYVNVGDVAKQGAPLLDLRSTEVEKLQVELLRTVKSLSIVEQSYARTKELTTNTVLTELEQLQQELIKAHGALQLAAAAVERTQQLSDKVVARKDLLAAQTEQQHARGAYDAALRKLRTYGVTEAQIRTILNGGLDKSVLTNLGLSPQAAVQKYLVLGKPSELFALEADYRQKQGEVESLKRQLQILGFSAASIATLLQRGVPDPILTLTAPISGAISARQATPGAMVEATEKLLELIDTSLVWIEGDVVEHLLTAVRPGQQARVRVAAYPEVVFTGIVRTMGRTVDPDKRTVHLWIEVPNPQGQLLPEMFATVTLITQAATDALAVPLQAILSEGAEQFVFVENGDTYVRQSVVLGLKDDRYVEIREGLFPGDRIVVRGGYELNAVRTVAAQQGQGGDGHAGHTH